MSELVVYSVPGSPFERAVLVTLAEKAAPYRLVPVAPAPQLDFLGQTPEWQTLTAHHVNLRRWLDRMRERPSLAATTWAKVAALGRPPAAAAAG